MEQERPNRKHPLPSSAMKTLTILVALVLCALVFVFVELRSNSAPPVVEVYTPRPTIEATPSPTIEPTPIPGLSKAVVIERLYDSGLFLVGTKNENYYYISATEEDLICSLSFSTSDGYVRGFTLELKGPIPPDVSKDPSAIEKALTQEYYEYLLYEDTLLRYLLPKLFSAIERDGAFPPNISLAWVELAIDGRISGKTTQDSGHGFSFTVSCTPFEVLTIAVGEE